MNEYLDFIGSVILANVQDEPKPLQELVRKYQIRHHSKTCKKYNSRECRFGFGQFFTHRTVIGKPIPLDTSGQEKEEMLLKRKQILTKVKDYINACLNPKKKNFLNPEQPNFEQILNIDEVFSLLNIPLDVYENCLSISSDESDFELHLKRETNYLISAP